MRTGLGTGVGQGCGVSDVLQHGDTDHIIVECERTQKCKDRLGAKRSFTKKEFRNEKTGQNVYIYIYI